MGLCKRCVQCELAAALRVLFSSVPSSLASDVTRADFLLHKAEVADWVALTEPATASDAKSLATRSRYQARGLIAELS